MSSLYKNGTQSVQFLDNYIINPVVFLSFQKLTVPLEFLLLIKLFDCILKSQYDDIQESATLEGYRCKDARCDGFLFRDPGM